MIRWLAADKQLIRASLRLSGGREFPDDHPFTYSSADPNLWPKVGPWTGENNLMVKATDWVFDKLKKREALYQQHVVKPMEKLIFELEKKKGK